MFIYINYMKINGQASKKETNKRIKEMNKN